jgi:hypothetical protein
MEKYILQNKLIEELDKSNIIANERLLLSWRTWGVIPYRRKGLGRGKGSITEYPASIIPQVKRLLELLDEKRSLSWATYQLWCEGYPVNLHKVLKRDLRKIKDSRNELLRDAWHDEEGEGGGTIEKEGQKRLRSKLLKRIRQAIGKESFVFWVETIIIVFTGLPYYYSKDIDALIELIPTNLGREGITIALQHATSLMLIEHLEDILKKARDTDFPVAYNFLETAINELRSKFPILRDIPQVSEWDGVVLSFGLLFCLSLFADQELLEMYHLETTLPAEI